MKAAATRARARAAFGRVPGPIAGVAAALTLAAVPASAQLAPAGGGAVAPGAPAVTAVTCLSRCIGPAAGVVKSRIRLTGAALANVTVVSLPRADGTRAKDKSPVVKPNGTVLATVAKGAVTGAVRVGDSFAQVHDAPVTFTVGTLAELKAIRAQYRFPVLGEHDYGDESARFGAARDGHFHQGQDVFAACGTPLVAPHSGIVELRGFHGSAGNYLVIDGAGVKEDYVLMHLNGPAKVGTRQSVTTGQFVGRVGATGNAAGCHLHFEIWTGKGWYAGGSPIDPLPALIHWDGFT